MTQQHVINIEAMTGAVRAYATHQTSYLRQCKIQLTAQMVRHNVTWAYTI